MLGMSYGQTMRLIILPQALIVALRPYGNEIIFMIKGSAVVAVVTVLDLMGQTRYAFSRTFDYQTYLWAAIFYLAIVETLRHTWAAIEARLRMQASLDCCSQGSASRASSPVRPGRRSAACHSRPAHVSGTRGSDQSAPSAGSGASSAAASRYTPSR